MNGSQLEKESQDVYVRKDQYIPQHIVHMKQARMGVVVNFLEAGGDMQSDDDALQLDALAPDRQRALAELVETQFQGQLSGAQGTESESMPLVFPVMEVEGTSIDGPTAIIAPVVTDTKDDGSMLANASELIELIDGG